MRLIDRCVFLLSAVILYLLEAFISLNFAESMCYVLIFLMTLSLKINTEPLDISIFAVCVDICSQRFIGISFVSYMMVYFLTLKYQTTLRNFHPRERIYYFFMILCVMKFVVFLCVFMCGGKFNLSEHVVQVIYSTVLIFAYYVGSKMWKNMSHALKRI